ncbi:DNA double-strand break repair nuclease NurA [Candidatus Micrarchaeota archaeon]|nr:DNA double-strand break repair nuclease NurA [Candidatus Micrarchaeota archaeon]MBU2476619.1 DNA double-strand break repair nuclease NurA [Candidatus Micrarchaeota archaeon]
MNLNSLINNAVSSIKGNETKKKGIAGKLAELKKEKNLSEFNSSELLEDSFAFEVFPAELNHKIAGTDSGFVGKRMHSIDIILIKTVSAIFSYKKNKLEKAEYFPSPTDFPLPFISSNTLENDEFECNKSLMRLKEEISCSKKVIKEFKPDYCLIDGSIIPQYADKARKESQLHSDYSSLIKLFESLYQTAEENSCNLIATVEDSRGSRFRSILQKEILEKNHLMSGSSLDSFFDSSLLDYLLAKNQRSFCFNYSSSIKEHPILNDFNEKWASRIKAFYLKPSLLDRPLRIEFLHNGKELTPYANEIASVILSLSSLHKEYAYPSVLIEADLRARLKPNEIEILFNKIQDKLGRDNAFMALRRNSRPF